MIGLIPAEIRRQIGRKASFFGAMIWVSLFGLGVLVWSIFAADPSAYTAIESGAGLLGFGVVLGAIVVGALAGSYDVDQGVMRYLVMTGRPRWQLVFVRVPALLVTITAITLPAILLILIASLIAGGRAATGELYFDLFYSAWMAGMLYGLLSLAIGMFLKSNGVAIAAAVVLNFAGLVIAAAIYTNVSETLGNAFFPVVAGVVIDREAGTAPDETFSVGMSAVVVVIWLVALLGGAYARVHRSEY